MLVTRQDPTNLHGDPGPFLYDDIYRDKKKQLLEPNEIEHLSIFIHYISYDVSSRILKLYTIVHSVS